MSARRHPRCSYCPAEADDRLDFGAGPGALTTRFACGAHYEEARTLAMKHRWVQVAHLRVISAEAFMKAMDEQAD